jgi:chemotaxis protein CheD
MPLPKPDDTIEVFLQPGELYFGDRNTRIRTVLGSCVSLAFWHPGRHVGGMCHYMLPGAGIGKPPMPDSRYADNAVSSMFREIARVGTRPDEYQVKMFGGANMFPDQHVQDDNHVGLRNVAAGRELLSRHGLKCVGEDLAGVGHRSVVFDIWSGKVWIKHQAPLRPAQMAAIAGTAAAHAS